MVSRLRTVDGGNPFRILLWWTLILIAGTGVLVVAAGLYVGEDWGALVIFLILLVVARWTVLPLLVVLIALAVFRAVGWPGPRALRAIALVGPPALTVAWFVATSNGSLL